jgi:thiol-disulfide isomerase/thioredoxin
MDVAFLLARWLLAAVFAVAGLAKLADRMGSRQALMDFGVPARLATPLSILLPLAEMAIAAALIPTSSAWWGAIGALLCLLLFIAGISINLARGHRPACHCFGQLSSKPVGWPTLARNGALAAIAAGVVWYGPDQVGLSAMPWLVALTPVQLAGVVTATLGLAVLAAESWILLHLIRQNGRLLLRMDALEARLAGQGLAPLPTAPLTVSGLPIGGPAPTFRLTGLYGEMLTLESLRAPGKPVMLIFSDPNCGPCLALLPDLASWQREHAAQLTIALISRGTPEANRAKFGTQGISHILLQGDQEVASAYQAVGTPTAVLVRPDGTIGSPLAPGTGAITALVAQTVGQPAALPAVLAPTNGRCPHCGQVHGNGQNGHGAAPAPSPPPAVPIGAPAPGLTLPDLSGQPVDLAAFRGRQTLALFWNPGCGFCQQMLPDLKAWEADPPSEAPQLLVISTGTVEANQAMGLRSPVVLDQSFTAGRSFGATGTPSAVLLDAQGRMASPVAVGAAAVLALAAGPEARAHGGQNHT